MNRAGTVLSQPPISTTASIGWARIISSVSIAIRLRNIMLVGHKNTSPSEWSGIRPAGRLRHDAAFYRFDQLRKVPVAVVEAARRLGDTDDWPRQHLVRKAHRLGKRAPQIERKIGVAVIGQPARQAMLLLVRQGGLCFFQSNAVQHQKRRRYRRDISRPWRIKQRWIEVAPARATKAAAAGLLSGRTAALVHPTGSNQAFIAMTDKPSIVFLFDVDNTLLDNDRIQALFGNICEAFGTAARDRYREILEQLIGRTRLCRLSRRAAALSRHRMHSPDILLMSS